MAASVATKEKEEMEKMHSILVCPACTDALMVLDSVISSSDANMRIVKVVYEVKDFFNSA
jgi:hypothetical protein